MSVKSVLSPAVTSQTNVGRRVSSVETVETMHKVDNGYSEGGLGSRIFVTKTFTAPGLFGKKLPSKMTFCFPLLCYFNSVKIL